LCLKPLPKGLPADIENAANIANRALHDPKRFASWITKLKEDVGKEMLAAAEALERAGKGSKARELRALLEKGEIDRGAYVRVLQRRASSYGWGTIRSMHTETGKIILPAAEFRRKLSTGMMETPSFLRRCEPW